MNAKQPHGNADNVTVTPEIERALYRLQVRYVQCLDNDELEVWPTLFTEDCRYVIHPRENLNLGLDGYWLYFDNNAMLRDRVTSLRNANLYNIHQDRHLISGMTVVDAVAGEYRVHTSYAVIQTDVEGRARIFSVGEYRDRVVETPDGFRLRERIVVPDNFNVEGMIAIPL